MEPDPVSWRELLVDATHRLRRLGGANDAKRIVEEASGTEGAALALVLDEKVTKGGMHRFDSMVARRAEGEPLQYVLGHWGFRNLDLMVDARVLVPRPETEQVVEVALRELDRLGGRDLPTNVIDLGTGSGAIALAIATERVRASVWATDVSPDALAVARANLVGIGRPAARVSISEGDWFEAVPDELAGTVQLIVCNPPYVPVDQSLPDEVADWEPPGALRSGADGLDDIRRIMAGAPAWLEPAGVVVCEMSPEQATTAATLGRTQFADVEVEQDLAGRARALVARRPIA